jgi:ribosomal silencing factor RsfS
VESALRGQLLDPFHVFMEEDRLFYDLERIWRDGKDVNIASL